MMNLSDFALRDPTALGAVLDYDWRIRGLLTDKEIIQSINHPLTTSVLRQLQRLGLVRSILGARPRGGRMRLWPMQEVLRIQIALDLRSMSKARLGNCVHVLLKNEALIDKATQEWESYIGIKDSDDLKVDCLIQNRDLYDLATDLSEMCKASVYSYVSRNAFECVTQPSFLM